MLPFFFCLPCPPSKSLLVFSIFACRSREEGEGTDMQLKTRLRYAMRLTYLMHLVDTRRRLQIEGTWYVKAGFFVLFCFKCPGLSQVMKICSEKQCNKFHTHGHYRYVQRLGYIGTYTYTLQCSTGKARTGSPCFQVLLRVRFHLLSFSPFSPFRIW